MIGTKIGRLSYCFMWTISTALLVTGSRISFVVCVNGYNKNGASRSSCLFQMTLRDDRTDGHTHTHTHTYRHTHTNKLLEYMLQRELTYMFSMCAPTIGYCWLLTISTYYLLAAGLNEFIKHIMLNLLHFWRDS